jgi:glycosyltransferase involved in cell wall biosynthesis
MDKNKHVVFTSVNFNYVGRALTLARSVKKYDPSIHFVLLLVEPQLGFQPEVKGRLLECDDGNTFDEILTISDLDLSQNNELQNYSVVEMCTAVKGQAAVQLLARKTSLFVTYLDPDLFFYGSLEQIRGEHSNGDVLLTPHLNHIPYLENIILNDEIAGVMRHGIFNLGFISFKNTKNGRDIASWWADKLNTSSRVDYENGLFTDQKWWDLSQIYFKNISIIKNDGWNMAPWNVSERRLVSLNPPMLDSGNDLFFFHFSKYPSKVFDDKIRSQVNSTLLNELVRQYGVSFYASQAIVDELLLCINSIVNLTHDSTRFVLNIKPKLKKFFLVFDISIEISRLIRKIVTSNDKVFRIARKVHRDVHKLFGKIYSISDQLENASRFEKMNLDILIITHQGGGGVGEVVKDRVREHREAGKSIGILKPNTAGEIAIYLNNSSRGVAIKSDLSKVIAQASAIEVHHILGFEDFLDELSELKCHLIYLHDKYFITQMPFSDTLKYVPVLDKTQGVNLPLNRESNFSDPAWVRKTRKLLLNSSLLRAPSDFLINEYKLAFPELKIEKFGLDPNFQAQRRDHQSANMENIILISPTGVHKGSSILASVARILESQKPSTRFRVFGDLDILTEKELKKLQNVTLYGQVSRVRLNNALSTSVPSLGWIPSLTGESYSLALSDFLSNGIIVIAANVGALHERLIGVPGNYLYDPSIPSELLARLVQAILENNNLDEFVNYFQFT